MKITSAARSWVCSAIYASPTPSACEDLWGYLQSFSVSIQDPWLLMGDFNEVLLSSEIRRANFVQNRADKFANMMDSCNLMDIGAVGYHFTWFHKVVGGKMVAKRLDRALANVSW